MIFDLVWSQSTLTRIVAAGSADTVCPRPTIMAQVQHFVNQIKKRQRRDVQYRVTLLLILVMLRLLVVDVWAIGRGLTSISVGGARRHRYRSTGSSNSLLLVHSGNWQITVYQRQNSRFGKQFLKIRLNCNVTVPHYKFRILRASLMQIDTQMAEKYANHRYAVSSHWK